MRISQIKFKTNCPNPGDRFRHEHAEVTVDLNEGDGPLEAFELARQTAEQALGIDVNEDDIDAAEAVLERARRAGLRG